MIEAMGAAIALSIICLGAWFGGMGLIYLCCAAITAIYERYRGKDK